MKRIIFFALCTWLISNGIQAQVEFYTVNSQNELDHLYDSAARENLDLFVDVFATWCGPCKWMDANVFELKEAGRYMNSRFISIKIDGDSEYGYAFARENGLEAYPTFFIFNPERKLMNRLMGAKGWDEFKPILETTIQQFPVMELYQKKYDSGMLEREEYATFVEVLRNMGKNSEAENVASNYMVKYIRAGKDHQSLTDHDIRVLAMHTLPTDSIWNVFTADPFRLQQTLGEQFEGFMDHIFREMLISGVESGDEQQIDMLRDEIGRLTAGSAVDARELKTRAKVLFFAYSNRHDELIEFIDQQYSNFYNEDHAWLFAAAVDAVFVDPNNGQMVEKGIEWFTECARLKPVTDYYYHLGYCYYLSDSLTEALESFRQAADLAPTDEERDEILEIIRQIGEQD